MDDCINPFFSVVLVLWHNHLTSFVVFILINRWLVVAFSLQGRCSPFSQPLSAKLVLFFSNNNGFMQKTAKSLLFSYYLCTFAYSNEPLKQAGGSASSDLIIRRLQQDTDIRWFPVRNLENRVISQTSDKQRWFENSSKVMKKVWRFGD